MHNNRPLNLKAKLVIIGDSCVGKTALLQAFLSDGSQFPKNYLITSNGDISTKQITVPNSQDSVELFIIDCMGKESFCDITARFWNQPSAALVVYDCTNPLSLSSAPKWIERLRKENGNLNFPIVLVGAKCDLIEAGHSAVDAEEINVVCRQYDIEHASTSAKDFKNVDEVFNLIAKDLHRRFKEKASFLST